MFIGADLCSTWRKETGSCLASIATWTTKAERDYAASQAPKRSGYLGHDVYEYDVKGVTRYALTVRMSHNIDISKG